MKDPGNRKIETIIFIISFLWMLSPIYLPDEYSGYIGEEKEMIEKAVDDADVELGTIQRFSVKSLIRYDSEWEIKIIHYTIFNIPVRESNITVVRSDNGFHATDGSFTDIIPFASWIILLSALATYFIVFVLPVLSIVWIVIERVNLREMARSHDKSKWAIPVGVVAFIALLNSIVFSLVSMIILDSVEIDRIIGDFGMNTVMILAPLIPSGLISFILFRNRRWVYYTMVLTLVAGLYIAVSCFYCIGSFYVT